MVHRRVRSEFKVGTKTMPKVSLSILVADFDIVAARAAWKAEQ